MQRPSSERPRSSGSAAAWVLAPLLAALVGVAVVPEALHARLPDAPPLHQRWMATPTTVERLRAIDPAIAALYFDRRGSYVLGGGLDAATATDVWASERQFELDLAAGAIDPSVRYVLYDPEWWTATPQARRANPDVVVLAGLSTRFATGPDTLLNAWDSVADIVDGHYMAVPEGIRPDIAVAFLQMLAQQRG